MGPGKLWVTWLTSNITPQHKLANINFFCLSNISPLCVCMVFWMVVIETINLTGLILISKHVCCLVWNKEKKFYFELKECPLWKVEKLGNALFLLIWINHLFPVILYTSNHQYISHHQYIFQHLKRLQKIKNYTNPTSSVPWLSLFP